MKKALAALVLLAGAGILLAPTAGAQPEMYFPGDQLGTPVFHLDAVNFYSPESNRTKVIIYIEVVNDNLQFVRSGRGYEASFEMDLSLLAGVDESAPRYENRIWRDNVVTSEFEETNSRELFHITQTSLDVPPGTYYLIATLTDLETRRSSKVKTPLKVPAYGAKALEISDLIFAKSIRRTRGGGFDIVPNVERIVFDTAEPLYIYFETYLLEPAPLTVLARVTNEEGEVVLDTTFTRGERGSIIRDYMKLNVSGLPVGRYVLEMQGKASGASVLKRVPFRVHVEGLPTSVTNIDDAIRQLRYIASTKEMQRMLRAKPSRRGELFRAFWKSKDPTPETVTNELMEEYYRRVEEASRMFGSFREGWETDMGEVYIRFGPPSEVERHPFDIDSRPYEIWYYYDIQRRFIFVDEMGYGEYRLVTDLWR